jgi:hypothetical protein
MRNLIVIQCNEDGEASLFHITEEQFLTRLNDGTFGNSPRFAKPGEVSDLDTFTGYILIRGEIIQPKPVEVVKRYGL